MLSGLWTDYFAVILNQINDSMCRYYRRQAVFVNCLSEIFSDALAAHKTGRDLLL